MSNDKKLTHRYAQIDKETQWQQMNLLVDEVVALLGGKETEGKKN